MFYFDGFLETLNNLIQNYANSFKFDMILTTNPLTSGGNLAGPESVAGILTRGEVTYSQCSLGMCWQSALSGRWLRTLLMSALQKIRKQAARVVCGLILSRTQTHHYSLLSCLFPPSFSLLSLVLFKCFTVIQI